MKIGSIKENSDSRVAISPESAKSYIDSGYTVILENGYADHLYSEKVYTQLGVLFDKKESVCTVDILVQVNCPVKDVCSTLNNLILICFLQPFYSQDHLLQLKKNNVICFSMELVPRSTIAQKMDALSSQSSLAGYVSVVLGASKLSQVFPMMVTPAGTLKPTKVLVIGAGVAGLQAIATAKRLGAQVSAFDTRSIAKEQVESLGAKFLNIDVGSNDQTKQGYAKEFSSEELTRQQTMLENACIESDLIVTTAQVFSKKAPIIITKSMITEMKPGAVIVDCAVETGGNVEGVEENKEVVMDDVLVIGYSNLAQNVALHASQVYAKNIYEFILECFSIESNRILIAYDHEIVESMLVVKNKEIVHQLILEIMNQ